MISAGLAGAFARSTSASACATFVGLVALRDSGYGASMPAQTLMFWAIAVIIVCLIRYAGGKSEADNIPSARYYIAGGALAGMLAGFTLGGGWTTAGAALGALLGGLAWSRTPRGRDAMGSVWRMIVTAGLPAVVVMAMAGLALQALTAHLANT